MRFARFGKTSKSITTRKSQWLVNIEKSKIQTGENRGRKNQDFKTTSDAQCYNFRGR
jgi:hypothetical protein